VIAAGVFAIVFFPRSYRSEARIFLRLGRENVGLDPTATTGHTVLTQQADRKDEVLSVIDVIQSRGVVAQAVDHVGVDHVLNGGPGTGEKSSWLAEAVLLPVRAAQDLLRSIDPISDRERAIVQVERNLKVFAERGSTLIVIRFETKTPAGAQAVCQAILDVYQQEHMRIHRNEDSRPFFTDQRDQLQKQLDDALEQLRSAKNDMGLSSVEQRRDALEGQFTTVESARLNVQEELAAAQARATDLERQLAMVPERLVDSKKSLPNSGADLLRQQLYALQTRLLDLQARYNEVHPLVVAANNQVKEAQRVLAQQSDERAETTDRINPIHRQLALDLRQVEATKAGLRASLAELSQQKEAALADLRAINDHELRIDQLSRQADLARGNFIHYAQNMEEARIDQELEAEQISNLSVVHSATLAEKPVSPSKPLVALATMFLATFGTAALVLGSEQLNDRLRTEEEVARELELPVLATIPVLRGQNRWLPITINGAAESGGRGG
jgi:uncharacterized protein involved in exopolysaccharide biosynthesis